MLNMVNEMATVRAADEFMEGNWGRGLRFNRRRSIPGSFIRRRREKSSLESPEWWMKAAAELSMSKTKPQLPKVAKVDLLMI